ncbi:sugar kinase [Urechidicola sp. KH5]
MNNKLVCFGEIMMRLSAKDHQRLLQTNVLDISFGGAEFNVAVSAVNFGISAEFVTRLPENDFGQRAIQEIRKHNVACNNLAIGGERLGVYFLEMGIAGRSSKVVYDRSNSAIATIPVGTIEWDQVLKDASWFHWSGVTPAISQNAADECLRAIKKANEMGITISCDLNYRSKLWKYGKAPHEIMPELLQYSNVILGDIDTALFMLGKNKVAPDYQKPEELIIYYNDLFSEIKHLKFIATSLRYSESVSHQRIGGLLYDGSSLFTSSIKEINPVLDRVGSGDAFMGGLIYGLTEHANNLQYSVDFATSACCIKHTILGDFNLTSVTEVERLMKDNSGLVSR